MAFEIFRQFGKPDDTLLSWTTLLNLNFGKALSIKYKDGAFTISDLNFGEVGIDTTNSRLYVRYNSTTVKYVSLT